MDSLTFSLILRLPVIAVALAACLYSGLLARATYLSRASDPASIEAAIALVPFNADFGLALDGVQSQSSPELLHHALELNPYQSNAWIHLGLDAELKQGDLSAAERYYIEATKVDHMYLPAWTLVNFYARQRNTSKFLQSAKVALALEPRDARPILNEAQLLSIGQQQLLKILPDSRAVRFDYLNLEITNGDPDQLVLAAQLAAGPAMHASASFPGQRDSWINLLGQSEDELIQLGRAGDAIGIWQTMRRQGWVRTSAPSIAAPLSNGSFRNPVFGHGFDWSIPAVKGITSDQYPEMGKMSFAFDGTQPESCRLLQQMLPVASGGAYRLRWEADSADLRSAFGLKWRLYGLMQTNASSRIALSSPDVVAGADQNIFWNVEIPAEWKTAVLTLEYDRPLGQVRAEGSVNLRNISMASVARPVLNSKGSLQ